MIQPNSPLILPGNPLFSETLGWLPPDTTQIRHQTNGDFALVARADTGLLEAVSWAMAEDYIYGGELDEREADLGLGNEFEEFGGDSSNIW